jgi:excisionase family DNA binding protein
MLRRGPTNMNAPSTLLTLKQVCAYLSVSRSTIQDLIKETGLPGYKLRGQWRFRLHEVDAWLEGRKPVGDPVWTSGGHDVPRSRTPTHAQTAEALAAIVRRAKQQARGT